MLGISHHNHMTDTHSRTQIRVCSPKPLRPLLRFTVLTDDPPLTKWQMGRGGFLTSPCKQRRAGVPQKKTRPRSVFFHPPLLYFWRTYWHERRECVGKVTAAPGVWRGTKWKNNEWKLCSLPQPWRPNPSPSPSLLFSFLAPASRVFHPILHPSYCFFFFRSSPLSLSFSRRPSPLPVCSHVSRSSFLVRCSSSPISIVDASLSLSLLFMSFWPRSHFPNWLSGSLIILRHPCCRLFYLSACRHPNPLISKHPSSAHTASQQPTAFPVYFSTVHTDGPSTSSRQARHRVTLRAAQVKDPVEYSSGTPTDRNISETVQPSSLTPLHQFAGERISLSSDCSHELSNST